MVQQKISNVSRVMVVACTAACLGCTPPLPEKDELSDAGPGSGRVVDIDQMLFSLIGATCGEFSCVVPDPDIVRIRNSLLAGRIEVSEATFEACLAAEQADTRSGRVSIFNDEVRGTNAMPACRGLWIPRVPAGEPCDTDFACIDGYCDRGAYSRDPPLYRVQECGVCRPINPAGATCVVVSGWTGGDQRNCAPGVACTCAGGCTCDPARCTGTLGCGSDDAYCLNGACIDVIADGQPCDEYIPCRSQCVEGMCGRRERGDACSYDWFCAVGSYCSNGTCVATTPGSYCHPYTDAPCPAGSACVEIPNGEDGEGTFHLARCITPGGEGDICPSVLPGGCTEPTTCLGDASAPRCLSPAGPGEPCTHDAACVYGGICVGGACEVPAWIDPGPPYCVLPPE